MRCPWTSFASHAFRHEKTGVCVQNTRSNQVRKIRALRVRSLCGMRLVARGSCSFYVGATEDLNITERTELKHVVHVWGGLHHRRWLCHFISLNTVDIAQHKWLWFGISRYHWDKLGIYQVKRRLPRAECSDREFQSFD